MADRFWGKNWGEREWEEGLSVCCLSSPEARRTPPPLGLYRGSVSGLTGESKEGHRDPHS